MSVALPRSNHHASNRFQSPRAVCRFRVAPASGVFRSPCIPLHDKASADRRRSTDRTLAAAKRTAGPARTKFRASRGGIRQLSIEQLERFRASGADGAAGGGQNLLGTLINLLVAEKSGFKLDANGNGSAMKELAERLTRQSKEAMQAAGGNADGPASPLVEPAPKSAMLTRR